MWRGLLVIEWLGECVSEWCLCVVCVVVCVCCS